MGGINGSGGRWRPGGLAYRRFRRMETKVLRAADSVICISETLRQEAILEELLKIRSVLFQTQWTQKLSETNLIYSMK